MIKFFFDFETRSRQKLPQVGLVKYATCPSTEVTLLTWAFDQGEVKAWHFQDGPVPPEVVDVALHPENYNMIAHNAAFDLMIWIVAFARRLAEQGVTLVKPPIENVTDSAALTSHFGAGAALDGAAKCLGLPVVKDQEGKFAMHKQCKPHGKTGEWVELTPQEKAAFIRYGKIDTKLVQMIYAACPPLPFQERWAWEWTTKRNLRGIRVDTDLLGVMNAILKRDVPDINAEFKRITNGLGPNQRERCLEWFKQYYPVDDMQAATVREMLARKDAPPHARRALELKQKASSTSVSKVAKATQIIKDGRIYDLLKYHEAHTKRWAGKGIQIHNFPRPDQIPDLDMNVSDLAGPVARIARRDPEGITLVKNLLRRWWLPDEGKHFYCGDYGKVEPTVLFWFLGLGGIPKLWYEETAAAIFNIPVEEIGKESRERDLGKRANLGCQYGQGPKKFRDVIYQDTGEWITEDLAKQAVYTYRRKYHQIVRFWKELELAFRAAIDGRTVSIANGKIHMGPMKGRKGVAIRLPSGSHLYYHNARVQDGDIVFNKTEGAVVFPKKLYGGLLCEHVTSATGRDLLLGGMYRVEQEGFEVLTTIHDEIWAQSSAGRGDVFTEAMCRKPGWCHDIHLTSDLKEGVRYLK